MLVPQPAAEDTDDVLAILQLAHAYAHAISYGDPRGAAQVYAPDGVLHSPIIGPVTGRDAIADAIAEGTKELAMIFHSVHSPLVVVDGDRADARFQISEWSVRARDHQTFFYLGFYDDELVRLPEGWRFARRTLVSRVMARSDMAIPKVHDLDALRPQLGG